jgi:hypothetical protein
MMGSSRGYTIPNCIAPTYYQNMRTNLVIISISVFIGVAYGTADLAAYTACHLLDKAVIALCPELDLNLRIRDIDEDGVRILLEKRGLVWEPMIGRTTQEIVKKWNKPSSIQCSVGTPGLEGDWAAPNETWQYDGYYLIFNQQHRCFWVNEDGVWN